MTPTFARHPQSTQPVATFRRCLVLAGLLLLLGSGCVTPWERSALLGGRNTGIDNVQGPNERRLRGWLWQKEQEEYFAENGSLKPMPGTEEYLKAEELYEQQQYAQAAKEFHKVAKKFKKSDIREDALFMQAESSYNLGHYAKAQDRYSLLLRDYPSTRHLDDVSRRLFEIARVWLDFQDAAQVGEVKQVNYDQFGQKLPPLQTSEKKRSWTPVFWPNFTDKARPLFDPEGNGVAALRLIWLNDPTGPLADDALMLAASHYARSGNFIEADRHYTLLREEYPNSPHVQNAFVLGSHVKLMSYEGPNYDSKSLEDAKHLKESTLRLYPNLVDRERVELELRKIEIARAAREWEQVIFHERKSNERGQAIYCHLLLERYPDTPYAKLARDRLKELGPQFASGQALLDPQPDPPRYKQTFGNSKPRLTNTPSSWQSAQATPAPASTPPAKNTPPANVAPKSTPSQPPAAQPAPSAPGPRSFVPWDEDDVEEEPLPQSPGRNLAPAMPEQAASSESSEAPASRWPRLLRFTPPRQLVPAGDAKPIDSAPAPSAGGTSGKASL